MQKSLELDFRAFIHIALPTTTAYNTEPWPYMKQAHFLRHFWRKCAIIYGIIFNSIIRKFPRKMKITLIWSISGTETSSLNPYIGSSVYLWCMSLKRILLLEYVQGEGSIVHKITVSEKWHSCFILGDMFTKLGVCLYSKLVPSISLNETAFGFNDRLKAASESGTGLCHFLPK